MAVGLTTRAWVVLLGWRAQARSAGSAEWVVPAGSAEWVVPAGSAEWVVPAGSAEWVVPAGSAEWVVPAGSAERAHAACEEGPLHHVGCEEGPLHHDGREEGPLHHRQKPGTAREAGPQATPAQAERKPPRTKPDANHRARSRAQPTPMACLPSRRPGEARSHRVKGPARSTPCTKTGPLTRCDSPQGGRREGRHTHPCQASTSPNRKGPLPEISPSGEDPPEGAA